MNSQNPPLAADAAQVSPWLSHVYAGAPGLISVCSDADKWAGRRFTTDPAGIKAATDYVIKLDKRQPKGIYTQVTTLREHPGKGRGGEDLAHALTHLWADGDFGTRGHKPGLDDLPAPPDEDAVQKVIAECGLPAPSGWVHSGGGYNPVWLLAENYVIQDAEDRARLKTLTMGWQTIIAAQAYRYGWSWDSEVGNLDRLMKLPGTINRKEQPGVPAVIGPEASGAQYDLADLAETATRLLPAAEEALAEAAREKQDRRNQRLGIKATPPRQRKQPRQDIPTTGDSPLDVLADHLTFADILEPEGWTYAGTHSDSRQQWKRPAVGGESSNAYSLLCDDHVAVNFSERADLPVGAQPGGRKLTVPYLWAHYNYAGDVSAAASDLLRAASGREAHGAAGSLSALILDDIKRRCGIEHRPYPNREEIHWDDHAEPPDSEDPPAESNEAEDRLPMSFWNATRTLQNIHQMARARRTSPDAVMHALLARVASMADPSVRVDSGVQRPATLCWFCGLFGPSGSGKGNAEDAAEELTPFPDVDLAHIDISTGQGLISAYLEIEVDPMDDSGKRKITVQKKTRGYALATEGSVLDAMAQMSAGGTLNGVLCKAWMSERQGTSNAEMERRRSLPKGAYTFSMSLGVQEEPAAKLLEMGSIGLPQRLAWAHATLSRDTPKERPPVVDKLTVTVGDGSETPVTYWVAGLRNTVITVPDLVTEEVDDLLLTISFGRGKEAPLDTHEPLWRVKCAALLALLHGRTAVTMEDWERSTLMWQTSRRVRDSVQDAAKRRLRAEADARRAEAVQTAVESQSAVFEAVHGVHPSVVNVAKRAHRYLTNKQAEMPARDVNRACVAKKDRDKFRESGATESLWTVALKYACEQGWLVPLEDGAVLTAGSAAPEQ